MSEEAGPSQSWTARLGRGLQNIVFEDDSSGEGALDIEPLNFDDDDDFHPTTAFAVEGSEQEGEPVDENTGLNSLNAPFSDIYANMGLKPDSQTDTVLEALSSMKGTMPDDAVRNAMSAMIKAMQADPVAIAAVLQKRTQILTFVQKAHQKAAADLQAARAEQLAASKTQADTQVAEFKRQIAAVEDRLAAEIADDQSKTASENAASRGLSVRMDTEIERIASLENFFTDTKQEG